MFVPGPQSHHKVLLPWNTSRKLVAFEFPRLTPAPPPPKVCQWPTNLPTYSGFLGKLLTDKSSTGTTKRNPNPQLIDLAPRRAPITSSHPNPLAIRPKHSPRLRLAFARPVWKILLAHQQQLFTAPTSPPPARAPALFPHGLPSRTPLCVPCARLHPRQQRAPRQSRCWPLFPISSRNSSRVVGGVPNQPVHKRRAQSVDSL